MKLYIYNQNSNGTSGLLICDEDHQVVDSIAEAIFGNIPAKGFSWSGDALGNINACFYGESVGMISYDDENLEAIENGEDCDIQQVVEVNLKDVLKRVAVSPVSDGPETLKTLNKYFSRKVGA